MLDFVAATDRVRRANITQEDIADALGVSLASVRAARFNPSSESYRKPPQDWAAALAKLVRDRERALGRLAEQLERQGSAGK